MFVAELYGLLALDPLTSIPGRAIDLGSHVKRGKQNEDSAEDTELCQRVRAVMKNLWHSAALYLLVGTDFRRKMIALIPTRTHQVP